VSQENEKVNVCICRFGILPPSEYSNYTVLGVRTVIGEEYGHRLNETKGLRIRHACM